MFQEIIDNIVQTKKTLWLLPHRLRSQKAIAKYVTTNLNCVCVNIGSGSTLLPGWLNGDIWPYPGTVYFDATGRLPFDNKSVHYINCEHMIEHIGFDECRSFFKECSRVLCDDGVLRITTPELTRLMQLYMGQGEVSETELLEHHRQYHQRPATSMCAWFNDHMHLWGHKFIFDDTTLTDLLRRCGFTQLTRCRFGESQYPALRNIERHHENVEWMKTAYLTIVEARKHASFTPDFQ
jgi:predicted SAM-dependent methyltransferase